MYVKELRLANFKSFRGEGNVFEFSLGINYFVGNNNAGEKYCHRSFGMHGNR